MMKKLVVEIWADGRQVLKTEISRVKDWTIGRFKEVIADYLGWPPSVLWTSEDETTRLSSIDRLAFHLTLADHQREVTADLLAAIQLAVSESPYYLEREHPELAEKHPHFRPYSRWELIEEYVALPQQLLIERPDEGSAPASLERYRALRERRRELQPLIGEIGVSAREMAIARRRIETREQLYQRPLGVERPMRWALPSFWKEIQAERNREKVRLQSELIHPKGKGRER